MSKLWSFVKLDFMTIKPYFSKKNLLVFGAMAASLSVTKGTILMSLGIGFMLGILFISLPFSIGEKNNMNALYVTVSVNRKTVVLGRYLSTILINICTIGYSSVFAMLGLTITKLTNTFQGEGGSSLIQILVLSGILLFVQTIQLPLFFKLGYTKARFISIIPLTVFVGAYTALMSINKESNILERISAALAGILDHGVLIAVFAVFILALAAYISYRLSLVFYQKREF